ncbi:iron-sulfur cluster repair di-iron protein [Niveispirillum sp. BGYR6]|uniref:iron-sulfur cluster repair di-iron protein n=1 Tax=Niveispirillum sp. BGYR6 TaxID=2971249 RepID=UPI0022B965CB|nr:iron-sulfur cluster repair di-iron protein [Niveispirillum sp. BGYR6]MDG5497438.1 iron-sulfur cluster repair di-iron protein [Niveispirillum sp. BGYR6]
MTSLMQPVSLFAATIPGATAIFRRHGIDFCCGGGLPLADAAQAHGLDPAGLLRELMDQGGAADPAPACLSTPALTSLILDCFHAGHRQQLDELLYLSQKVESVHGQHPDCPKGLHALLAQVAGELEEHMQKEEQVLFPAMLSGGSFFLAAPIACMMQEHDVFGDQLHQMAALTRDFTPPARACATWRALYSSLQHFVQEAQEHVHLENDVLFPRFGASA